MYIHTNLNILRDWGLVDFILRPSNMSEGGPLLPLSLTGGGCGVVKSTELLLPLL